MLLKCLNTISHSEKNVLMLQTWILQSSATRWYSWVICVTCPPGFRALWKIDFLFWHALQPSITFRDSLNICSTLGGELVWQILIGNKRVEKHSKIVIGREKTADVGNPKEKQKSEDICGGRCKVNIWG